jgi:BCD family chlorophyll transporter-like MFS transporter
MAVVLLTGTLNRIMIVELGVAAWLIAVMMVSLPLVFAPLPRALIGFRSDTTSLGARLATCPLHLVRHA